MARFRNLVLGGLLASAAGLLSPVAYAQTATVFGSNGDAKTCYMGAQMQKASIRNLKACGDALKEGELSRKDQVATYINRGILRKIDGNIEGAWFDYKTALRLSPDHPAALANRGNLYYIAGYYDQALTDYETALASEMKNPGPALLNRAMTLGWLARHDEARAQFEEVIAKYPEWALAKENYQRYQDRVNSAGES